MDVGERLSGREQLAGRRAIRERQHRLTAAIGSRGAPFGVQLQPASSYLLQMRH